MSYLRKDKRLPNGDQVFYLIVNIFATLILIIILYPLIYILSASFSSPKAVQSGLVILWPVDLSLEGYITVFKEKDVFIGFYNSLRYMIIGTSINVAATMVAAYPLARKDMPFRGFFMFLFTFTMFFNGGLIPNYILMQNLKIIDKIWAIVLPGAVAVWNLIIARTFIQTTIPAELLEAATIDGCSDARYFFKIVLPLSKAVIAVIALYYAVGHWNAYFNAFIYLNSRNMYPLQLILREILISNTIDPSLVTDPELLEKKEGLADLLKYSLIVISTVPMLISYPLIQKYFTKGVMIGSLKG